MNYVSDPSSHLKDRTSVYPADSMPVVPHPDYVSQPTSTSISTSVSVLSTADPQYKHLKLVKRGFRGSMEPKTCGILFESLPAWMWAIRLSDWESVVITDTDEARLRQYHRSTWSLLRDKLKIVRLSQGRASELSCVHVWFVSGSRRFIDAFDTLGSAPTIYWAE